MSSFPGRDSQCPHTPPPAASNGEHGVAKDRLTTELTGWESQHLFFSGLRRLVRPPNVFTGGSHVTQNFESCPHTSDSGRSNCRNSIGAPLSTINATVTPSVGLLGAISTSLPLIAAARSSTTKAT
jgi:hypothetical protein